MPKTLVADNGAFSLRLGFAEEPQAPRIVMPNQCALIRNDVSGRELVGEETEETHYLHRTLEFKRAHQRGCLLDKQVEEKVWTRALSQLNYSLGEPAESLLVTETPLVPNTSKRLADELFFEHFNFQKVGRVLPQTCIAADWSNKTILQEQNQVRIVVDCGYSATWIVPLLGCNPIWPQHMRRIDLGGKALTNLYKEELSWRHVNVMDDTKLVEDCKVNTCFVKPPSTTYFPQVNELYLLPDFKTDFTGRLLCQGEHPTTNRQTIKLSPLERMNIPEVLFDPMRIGLREMGLAETIQECINSLPFEYRTQARANILITGGTSRFPNFCSRLEHELDLKVQDWSNEYAHSAWRGAALFANSPRFDQHYVQTKQQYEEEGSSKARRKQTAAAPVWWQV